MRGWEHEDNHDCRFRTRGLPIHQAIKHLEMDIITPSEPSNERERHVVADVSADSVHITKRDSTGTKKIAFAKGNALAMPHLPQMYSLTDLYMLTYSGARSTYKVGAATRYHAGCRGDRREVRGARDGEWRHEAAERARHCARHHRRRGALSRLRPAARARSRAARQHHAVRRGMAHWRKRGDTVQPTRQSRSSRSPSHRRPREREFSCWSGDHSGGQRRSSSTGPAPFATAARASRNNWRC